tara:strand:- start:76 stop:507 length:432 start_codon:yes stop_codon:yes gene_type:complete
MKKIYRNFSNKKEVEDYLSLDVNSLNEPLSILNYENKMVSKVIETISKDFSFTIKKDSWWNVQQKSEGHDWHVDKNAPHCEVGLSMLIQEGDSGGDTYYADDIKGKNAYKVNRGLYDLVVHTSDEPHMVEPHTGQRIVFLMFI